MDNQDNYLLINEEFEQNKNINNLRKKFTKYVNNKYCLISIGIIILFMMIIVITLIIYNISANNNSNNNNGNLCTIINPSNIELDYPYKSNNIEYKINFNKTIMQANYVYYISTKGGNNCSKKNFQNDPYSIDIITTNDFTNSGFDRGHLVPNADYGCNTYIISNAVPMNPGFNRGIWAKSEKYIRDNYAGKLIYKGCDYSDLYIISNLGKKLYIPIGCYYIVFDVSELPYSSKLIFKNVLDYGYYLNENRSKKEKRLPYWIHCS